MTNLMIFIKQDVGQSLWLMLQGMLGIFIFMALFYIMLYLLDRLWPNREEE